MLRAILGGALGTWASEGAEDWLEMVFKVLLSQPNPSYILQRARSGSGKADVPNSQNSFRKKT